MTIDDIDEISLSRVDTGKPACGCGLECGRAKIENSLLRQHSRNFIVRGIRGMIHWNMKMERGQEKAFFVSF